MAVATCGSSGRRIATCANVLSASSVLPVRAIFLPWLADVLALRLAAPAGDIGAPIDAVPGQTVRLPAGAGALESPSGERRICGPSCPPRMIRWNG